MGNSPSTIDLNGKRYDTKTGAVIGDSSASQPISVSKEPGQILDGFVRRAPSKTMQTEAANPTTQFKPLKSTSRHTLATNAKRKLEKSRTLMRPVVKKPAVIKNDIQAVKRSTPSVPQVSHGRISRAESVEKSPHISKFGSHTVPTIEKREEDLPVIKPSLSAISRGVSNELNKLEHALQDANSHLHDLEQHTVKKVPLLNRILFKNRFANIATLCCAMLLLVGFFAYQNSASITMQIAASRAGVDAQLPGYKPSGYAINGGVKSEPGKVIVNYQSQTDDKGFTITQQASSWNSASLLANHVTKTRCNTCFQTWQNDGKTVYIYDNSNATWVNGGIWYQVEGNADLTSDQLLRLANSL